MGLEVIVRPRVIPDFRPRDVRDARSTNPQHGLCTINGGSGQLVELTNTFSSSTQKQFTSEEYRVFDIIRVFRVVPAQEGPDGKPGHIDYTLPLQPGERIDRNVYQDQEVMWQIIHVKHNGEMTRTVYKKPQPSDWKKGNMELLAVNVIRKTKGKKNLHDLILP